MMFLANFTFEKLAMALPQYIVECLALHSTFLRLDFMLNDEIPKKSLHELEILCTLPSTMTDDHG